MKTVTKQKRGIIGKLFQVIFWIFQVIMVWMVWINFTKDMPDCSKEVYVAACEAGSAAGTGIIAGVGGVIWLIGSVVLGLLMYATKGKQVTETIDE